MEINYPDQPERESALDLSRSFIVQAPAGSGKTELLIQRYLALLGTESTLPEEVLAITFTRKAALEMRQRVIQALLFGRQPMPSVNSHRLLTWKLAQAVLKRDEQEQWQLTQNPHRLRILTIDALCASLVRQAPFKSFLGEYAEIAEDDELYVKAVQELFNTLQEEMPWTTSLKQILLHLDNNYSLTQNLLISLLKKRDQWLTHLGVGQVDLSILRDNLEENLKNTIDEVLRELINTIPDSYHAELAQLACFAGRHVEAGNELHACANIDYLLPASYEYLSYWQGIHQLLMTQEGTFRKTVNVKNGFPSDVPSAEKATYQSMKNRMLDLLKVFSDNEILLQQFNLFSNLPSPHYSDRQWEMLTHILIVLPVLVAHLKLLFQQTRKIDYVEIILKALEALGEEELPTQLTLNLDYKIQHILVDEFQDTSFTQFHLLEKLTAGWQQGDGRSLFVVGDPMQSIYRFRKAEVGLFIRAAEQGIGAVSLHLLVLRANFRCQQTLMSWINDTFSVIFPKKNAIFSGAIVYSPSVAMQTSATIKSNVSCHVGLSEEGQAEAWGIKDIISSLLIKEPEHKIAILVRSRTHLSQIIPLLKNHHIPFNASEISAITESAIIQDLVALTRAIHYLTDRIAWLAVLRAPWCGLELADLTLIAEKNEVIWDALKDKKNLALSEFGQQRVMCLVSVLEQVLQRRQHVALVPLIENAWRDLGGEECLDSAEQVAQVELFFKLLADLDEGGEIKDRSKLNTALDKLFIHEANALPHAVEVMTIHKAKGLEFDSVILPGLQASTVYDAHALLLWLERPRLHEGEDLLIAPLKPVEITEHDPIYRYLRYMENQKAKNELDRLLYVAATRAKKNLFLTWSQKPDDAKQYAPPTGSFLALLWPIVKDMPHHQTVLSASIETNIQRKLRRFVSMVSMQESIPIDFEDANPRNDDQKEEENRTLLENRLHRNVGILVHRIFMQICQRSLDVWLAQSRESHQHAWKIILQGLGTPLSLLEKSLALAEQIVGNTLQDERGRWLLSPQKNAIMNYPVMLLKANKTEQIVIDRIFIDKEGNRWLVLFKMVDEAIEHPALFTSLTASARVLFAEENTPVCLGVYFPHQTVFFEKHIVMTE